MKTFRQILSEAKVSSISTLTAILNTIHKVGGNVHTVHWNVKGPNFDNLHADTGAIYDLLIDWEDKIAERIKALDPSHEVVKPSKEESSGSTLEDVIANMKTLSTQLKNTDSLDATTANMVQELDAEVDKWIWKLTNSK